MRAGTENLYGIVGFAKALELATANFEKDSQYIRGIKQYMLEKVRSEITGVSFNGDPEGASLYTVLSVNFPRSEKSEMLLFNLDINNICASGGSACTSGVETSHVIKALGESDNKATVRFSFSKYNTKDQIDCVITKLKGLI
jgi:cysteine desulfurase